MAKLIGSQKSGGRKKGVPNKRTKAFVETLEGRGIDLLGEILKATEGFREPERVNIYLSLMPYVYPKRKPVEIPFQFSEHLNLLSAEQLKQLSKELDEKLDLMPRKHKNISKSEFEQNIKNAFEQLEEDC